MCVECMWSMCGVCVEYVWCVCVEYVRGVCVCVWIKFYLLQMLKND